MVTMFVACPPLVPLWASVVNPVPAVNAPKPWPPLFLSMPIAPIWTSSACNVVAVVPEFSEVPFPVAVWNLSPADGDTRPLNEKKLAAMFTLVGLVIVIVPFRAVVTRAENRRVRMPLVPEPLVTSGSLVYVLPAVSATVTLPVPPSIAMVTKIVLAVLTLIPLNVGDVRVVVGPLLLAAPSEVAVTAPRTLNVTWAPINVLPALSIAV